MVASKWLSSAAVLLLAWPAQMSAGDAEKFVVHHLRRQSAAKDEECPDPLADSKRDRQGLWWWRRITVTAFHVSPV